MEQKIHVEMLIDQSSGEQVCCSLAFGAGLLTKRYLIDSAEFAANHAFGMILLSHLRMVHPNRGFEYDLQRTSSTITFESTAGDYITRISEVLSSIISDTLSEDDFLLAKKYAKESYKKQYKNASFRARLKAYEFSDLNKQVRLVNINRDLDTISFPNFLRIKESLLTPNNICICLLGNIHMEDVEQIERNVVWPKDHRSPLSTKVERGSFDAALRQDAHVLELAENNAAYSIIAFDFLNNSSSALCRQLIVDIVGTAHTDGNAEIYADSCDASIIIPDNNLQTKKAAFSSLSEEQFSIAKEAVLERYNIILLKQRALFVKNMAISYFCGFRLMEYLDFVRNCSYSLFCEIYEKADVKLSHGQVLLRKGGKRWVKSS